MSSPLAQLNRLRYFFDRIDDGILIDCKDSQVFRTLRREAGEALYDLLLWHRPFLEAETGLAWPYQGLAKRHEYLQKLAVQGETPFIRQQAQLFLALFPFPEQWRWLIRAEKDMGNDPEIQDLLSSERKKIAAKIQKKVQKKFKLHHFCQILKRPGLPEGKGILRIFSMPYLLADVRLLQRLNVFYVLYIEPPWGVLARHAWLRVFSQMSDPCIIGVGGQEDADFLNMQSGIITSRLAHGDFLEEEDVPLGFEKRFDLVFNATFDDMARKRHLFLVDQLTRPPLENISALFIGRGKTANVDFFNRAVRERGLGDRVKVLANVLRKDVPEHLSRCRLGVQTSLHENACRSIYESFRSDLPCLVTSSMAGFNFDLITAENGRVVSDRDFPQAVLTAVHHPQWFSARQWFLKNSGSRHSSCLLNEEFKELFTRLGYCWREDIVPLSSSGACRYVAEADYAGFRNEYNQLLEIMSPFLPLRLSPE